MLDLKTRLRQSDAAREAMRGRFGLIPESVLRITRGRIHRQLRHYVYERGHRQQLPDDVIAARKGATTREEIDRCRPSQKGTLINAYSMMPGEIVEFFIRYYAQPGDLYFDPFAGQGIQGQVAHVMGLHYVGQDVCAVFCDFMRGVFADLDDGTTRLEIHQQTSERAVLGDEEADFTFTSPPYWDSEHYDDDPAQLGTGRTYPEFLEGMTRVAAENLRVMKPGGRAIVNVNDFRREGVFYSYHADTIGVYQRAGWVLDDLWVIAGGVLTGLMRVFAVRFNEKRLAPKVHEYGLVFVKP